MATPTINLDSKTYVTYSEDFGIQVVGERSREGVGELCRAMRNAESMDDMPTVDIAVAEQVVAELSRRDGCEYDAEYFAVCQA